MKIFSLIALAFFLVVSVSGCSDIRILKVKDKKMKLVWFDEFNYTGSPDSSRWSFDEGDGCPLLCGWGNNELQYYTKNKKANCRVENGTLIIEALNENAGNKTYTSAKLCSRNKKDWTYGKIEVRAKLPIGLGLWPAIWMMPTNMKYGTWPMSGEIDIAENVGFMPDSIFGSVHTKAAHKTGSIHSNRLQEDFNIYSIEWNSEFIDFYFNNKKYSSYPNKQLGSDYWPFDKDFHLLLNLAVGGNWGGQKGIDPDIFPAKMMVDYVRLYQNQL